MGRGVSGPVLWVPWTKALGVGPGTCKQMEVAGQGWIWAHGGFGLGWNRSGAARGLEERVGVWVEAGADESRDNCAGVNLLGGGSLQDTLLSGSW